MSAGMGWIILRRRVNAGLLFIFNTENVVDAGGTVGIILEYCTDRITYLFTRYTSTEAMEEILIRLQLLYHGLLASCRNVYILCSQCRVHLKKDWRLHWQSCSSKCSKKIRMMTQKMRVIAMDELNQSAREKLMRKNRGKSYPPNQFFRNGCTLCDLYGMRRPRRRNLRAPTCELSEVLLVK